MKQWIWGIIIVLVVALGGWAILKHDSSGVSGDTIKVGVVGPFTGDAAVYGEPLRKTVALAIDEINAKGGINGKQIEAIYEDGKCNGQSGVSAAQKLINVDHVQAILGGFCSGETIPMVPIATQARVLLFSASASSPALTNISPYFFRDYPSDATQGKVLAGVANSKGWKTVAFIQEQTDYATGVYNAFTTSFEALGGKTTNDAFPTTATDFRSTLTKIKGQKPDALFIDTQTPAASDRILKQLHEIGWAPKLMVSDATMGDPATLASDASLLEGTIGAEFVPNMTDPKIQGLIQAYKAKYNTDLPYVGYMACAYDSVYLLADGIKSVGYSGEKLAAWSRTIKDWAGASGSITIGADGDRASGHMPEIIRNGKTQPLQ